MDPTPAPIGIHVGAGQRLRWRCLSTCPGAPTGRPSVPSPIRPRHGCSRGNVPPSGATWRPREPAASGDHASDLALRR
jgi:hypothetical protein